MTTQIAHLIRRRLGGVAVVGVVALIAAGCSSASSADRDKPESNTLSIVTFTGGDAGIKYENLIAAFEKANPEVDVKQEILAGDDTYNTILATRMASGTAPDIFEVLNNDLRPWLESSLLTDLTVQPWVKNEIETVQNLAEQTEGKTLSFVPEVNSGGVFYNVDMFEERGIEIPETWDEFLDIVKRFRADGITPLSVGGKDGWTLQTQWTQMMRATSTPEEGAKLTSGDLKYSKASTAAIIPAFADLVAAGGFDPNATGVDWPSSANDFALGRTAMMIQGTVALPAIRNAAPGGNFSMFPLPFSADGVPAPLALSPAATQAIPTTAANPKLAKKFLDFWASPEVHAKYLTDASALTSLVTSTAGDIDPAFKSASELLPTRGIEIAGLVRPTPEVGAAIQAGMQGLMVGSASVEQVLEAIDAAQAAGN
ncbi:raffinose/stachyose/melibiose transport system substrate-binding protein [Microbacterium sp. W4I4]|uniref:ABC transporter substrate-binding protein n=1 Tax=Microbacterium sp. W4I4 TaxID=3042295 RepID=UPI00277E7C79|nr:extracellular solute-binding protein [Microbacterium sp. W4I4]MDQ0614015.1 raffinose/stachyose/melibiose transport system substrate-binding protein [Microbacterium sp. W4I4]